jgi:hypothetical protein
VSTSSTFTGIRYSPLTLRQARGSVRLVSEDKDTAVPNHEPGAFFREVVAPEYGRRVESLREQLAALQRELVDRESAEASIKMVIGGAGVWFLNLGQGRMEVGSKATFPELFSYHQSHEDWSALLGSGAIFGGGGGSGPMPGRGIGASRVERLRAISGTIRIVLTGDTPDDERTVTLHFGAGEPASPAQVTVAMRDEDARKLRDGSLDPQAAFLQGRVTMTGDIALAVQLGTALFL